MNSRIVIALMAAGAALACMAAGQDKHKDKEPAGPVAPIGWLDLHAGPRKFSVSEEDFQKVHRQLAQGMLVPVFKTKEKRGTTLARVSALDLETGKAELGWVEITPGEIKPMESYPADSDLLGQLGSPYLDDLTAKYTAITRYLVRQTSGSPSLLCYVYTGPLSMAKLVIFSSSGGRFVPTTDLNVPISELRAGVTSLEVRDLLGDGSDCVIMKEHFREQTETYGTTLRIQKIVDGKFQDLWQAPLEFRNLSQYSGKMQILQPPEQNIGAPGTVTTGEVTFRPHGNGQEPVWKGKVEFFVFGREKAVDSVSIEKVCPWNGRGFAPLR